MSGWRGYTQFDTPVEDAIIATRTAYFPVGLQGTDRRGCLRP